MPDKFKVSTFTHSDKSIDIVGPLWFSVDYDDVNTSAVDLLIPHLMEILNDHWDPPYALICKNGECEEGYRYISYASIDFCEACDGPLVCEIPDS